MLQLRLIKPAIILSLFFILLFLLPGCGLNSDVVREGKSGQESDLIYTQVGSKVVEVRNVIRPNNHRLQEASPAGTKTGEAMRQIAKEKFDAVREMEFVEVPAGEFLMGSREIEGYGDEHPQHKVFLDAYRIGKYEVTNAQFAKFVQASGYKPQGDWRHFYWGQLTAPGYPEKYPDYPVINVTCNDAQAFCQWAGKTYGWKGCHLPTEAQWEKAAKGTQGYCYPWGDDWDPLRCNHWYGPRRSGMLNLYSGRGTVPVGSFPSGASPYGAMDMAGNVWEWCADWYRGDYYAVSPPSKPKGPQTGKYRVFRGGSCLTYGGRGYDDTCRCCYRLTHELKLCNYAIGFRCARAGKP